MLLCLLQLEPVVVFSCFSPWLTKNHLHQGFLILDSIPGWVGSCRMGPKAKGKLDFGRFEGSSALLLSGNTGTSKIWHQWYFSLQIQKRRKRRSRVFPMVEGNWDLYLRSQKNLSVNSCCPEWCRGRLQCSLGWRTAVQGAFWWHISGKLCGG